MNLKLTLSALSAFFGMSLLLSSAGAQAPGSSAPNRLNVERLLEADSELEDIALKLHVKAAARARTISNTAVRDLRGRVTAYQLDGNTVLLGYDGDRLVSVTEGDSVTYLSYAVSERTGAAAVVALRDHDGNLLDVMSVRQFLGARTNLDSRAKSELATRETKSAETLQKEFRLSRTHAHTSKSGRRVCASEVTSSCDGQRDMENAQRDLTFDEQMATVDYLRDQSVFPISLITSAVASAMATSIARERFRCKQRTVNNWLACITNC
jgi:hypothetical protein